MRLDPARRYRRVLPAEKPMPRLATLAALSTVLLAAAGTSTVLAHLTGESPWTATPLAAAAAMSRLDRCADNAPADPRIRPQSSFDPLFEPFFFIKTSRKVPRLLEKNGSKTSQKRALSTI